MKLTKAERRLLEQLASDPVACAPRSGSSAMTLRRAGYAEWDDQAGRGLWWLIITDAGRAALAQPSDALKDNANG